MGFNPKWVQGKQIQEVKLRPFPNGRGGTTYNPLIIFTDGSRMDFEVQETEGDYGLRIDYRPPPERV